jgi:hypothetical protein
MRTFDHEWILEAFDNHPTFLAQRMFGGLAVYLFERQMLLLVEPTKTGRWKWHGVLICTDHDRQASIRAEFPALAPHAVLRKWLFLDSSHDAFDATMKGVVQHLALNDPRFGIVPKALKPRTRAKPRSRTSSANC